LIYHGIASRRWVLMFSLLIVFSGLLLASMRYVPSLHNRYINTIQDIEAFRKGGDINHRSISMRLAAWEKSMEIFKDNPLWGVANADVHDEIKRRYEISNKYDLSLENQKGPHNQFFYVLAGSGLLGFLLFVLLMIHPVLVFFQRKDYLIFAIFIVMLVSFLVESVLERQVGVTFFCFFWTYFSKPREFRSQN
jgi:O-antigen ligase